MELKLNQEYKRSELHDIFGGSRQSGISTSAQTDINNWLCYQFDFYLEYLFREHIVDFDHNDDKF